MLRHSPTPRRHFFPHRRRRQPAKPQPQEPPEPTPYTRSTVHRIATLLRAHPWSTAQPLLVALPVRWDSYTVNRVLKTHPPMQKAFLFFRWAASRPSPGLRHDRFTYTTMLDIFGEAGRLAAMKDLFQEMRAGGVEPDAAACTVVMHWLAKGGDLEGALGMWEEMRARRGCAPTAVSYTACMKVLFEAGRAEEAAGVFREMVEEGLQPSCTTYTVLIGHLADSGKFEAAIQMVSKMQEAGIEPDKALCNILVQKCAKAGETSVMNQVLQYMKEHFIVLRRPVFLEALETLKANDEIDDLLREVNPHLALEGIDCDPIVTNPSSIADRSIILYFLATKNWSSIELMINEMTSKNTQIESHLLSEVIEASCASCKPSCGLTVLRYCLRVGTELGRPAYSCLLGQYIRNSSFDLVLEIVEGLIKSGCCLGTYLGSVLIYRLGCAGHSAYAAQIFRLLSTEQNVVTYTALMNAYFQAGKVDKALELFFQMRSIGISACLGTYDILISGLQKAGRTRDSGLYRKEKMRLQFNAQYQDAPSQEESLCNHLFSGFNG